MNTADDHDETLGSLASDNKSTQHDQCDVAIIGAGIIGLIAAYRLQQLRPAWQIQIFEKESKAGGRLVSRRPDQNGPVMEFGAGRFHVENHPSVNSLLTEFGIETQPFHYPCGEMRSQGEFSRQAYDSCELLVSFADTLPKEQRAHQSFLSAAEQCLSRDRVEHIICAIGYDSLYHPGFSLEHGLHVMLYHPETPFSSRNGEDRWRSPTLGFQSLAETIQAQLRDQCAFMSGHRLLDVKQVDNQSLPFRLTFDTADGHSQTACLAVICATHLRDLAAIKHTNSSEYLQPEHLVDVPLTKGYVHHAEPWWHDTCLAGKCITTHLPFRKLYFPTSGAAYLFYSDAQSAVKLNTMLAAGTAVPELNAEIKSLLPLTAQQQNQLDQYDCQWKFWPSGIVFWEEPTPLQTAYACEPAPNFFLCSDAFTPELGWIEGSLLSADAAVHRLVNHFLIRD